MEVREMYYSFVRTELWIIYFSSYILALILPEIVYADNGQPAPASCCTPMWPKTEKKIREGFNKKKSRVFPAFGFGPPPPSKVGKFIFFFIGFLNALAHLEHI